MTAVYLRFKLNQGSSFSVVGFFCCGCVLATLPQHPGVPTPDRQTHTTGGKFEGEHTALMKMQLVFLGLSDVQDLHVAALHANRQPVLVGAVAQGENLGVKREDRR